MTRGSVYTPPANKLSVGDPVHYTPGYVMPHPPGLIIETESRN